MELVFASKGIAVISVLSAGFSSRQCAVLLEMTSKQVGILAAATRRRGHTPIKLDDSTVRSIESIVGTRGMKYQAPPSRIRKEPGKYQITIVLGEDEER